MPPRMGDAAPPLGKLGPKGVRETCLPARASGDPGKFSPPLIGLVAPPCLANLVIAFC